MPKCTARDFYELPSSREITPQGFLRAPAKIARTGVQVYSRRELGLDGGDDVIRLFRPLEEVAKSSRSFESVPMADEHPPGDIRSDNWKQYAVGDVRDVSMDGEFLTACVIVRDEDAIALVRDGKAELSCGYAFNLDMTPGVTAVGEHYDAIQRDIEGNHVAIVDRGRAGSRVKIADTGDPTMPKTHRISVADHKVTDKLTIPGLTFDIELDDAAARSVQDKFDLHSHGIGAAKEAYDNLNAGFKSLQKHATALQDHLASLGEDSDEEEEAEEDETAEDASALMDKDDEMCADEETDDAAKDAKTGDGKGKGKGGKKKAGDKRVGFTKDGRMGIVLRLKRAHDVIAKLRKATAQDELEKLAEERAKVLEDARPFVGDEFEPKGKTVHQIRIAAIDAAMEDEGLKPIATIQIGDSKTEKLTVAAARRAFDTLVAMGGRRAAGDDGGDEDFSRALAGGGEAGDGSTVGDGEPVVTRGTPRTAPAAGNGGGVYGRDRWLQTSAADSRRHTDPSEAQQ